MTRARQHLCLAALLALGLLHGLMQARLRPLYQVSDELQYIFGAQQAAIAQATPIQRPCISPPDGSLLEAGSGGGKWAFRSVTAYQLAWGCRAGGEFPLFLLRTFNALSLPILIGATWLLARSIWPDRVDVAILAGLLPATHPELVKYSSGVTPDAWANALAAIGFVTGARIVLGLGGFMHGVVLVAVTALALTWKETATFLVLHLVLVAANVAWRTGTRLPAAGRGVLAVVGLAAAAIAGTFVSRLLAIFGTTYNVQTGVLAAWQDPVAFGSAVLADLLTHSWGMLVTSWTVLGNFGGTNVAPVPTATAVALLTVAAALIGWCVSVVAPLGRHRPYGTLACLWSASVILCLLQPSVRQVWAATQDVHQGRWLFTLAAPAAVVIAAGVARVRSSPGWLALPAFVWLSVMWVTLGQLGQWYYARIPDVVRHQHVFVRGTGGNDLGEARVLALIDGLARQQAPAVFWFQASLLLAVSAIMLWLLFSSTYASNHDCPAHHR